MNTQKNGHIVIQTDEHIEKWTYSHTDIWTDVETEQIEQRVRYKRADAKKYILTGI